MPRAATKPSAQLPMFLPDPAAAEEAAEHPALAPEVHSGQPEDPAKAGPRATLYLPTGALPSRHSPIELAPLLKEARNGGKYRSHAAGQQIAEALAALAVLRAENPGLSPGQGAAMLRERTIATNLTDDVISRLAALDTAGADMLMLEDQRNLLHLELMDGRDGRIATPSQVADFLTLAVNPQPDSRVLDLCCGAGRLLVHAAFHMKRHADGYGDGSGRGRLQGIEINQELATAARAGLALHRIQNGSVLQANSLDPAECRRHGNKEGIDEGNWDVIMANLPLGLPVTNAAAVTHARKGQGILAQGKPGRKAEESEILMLQRVWDLLAPGTGRAALIVSDAMLSNANRRFAREWLMERFQLDGVISLPRKSVSRNGAKTAAKTSALLLRRLAPGETLAPDSLIFMAICKNDGDDGRQETSHRLVVDNGQTQPESNTRTVMLSSDLLDYATTETRLDDGRWARTGRMPVVNSSQKGSILSNLWHFFKEPETWKGQTDTTA